MKLFFSILLFSHICWGRDYFVIQYSPKDERSEVVRNILINQFNIPKFMIAVRQTDQPCRIKRNVIFQICLEKDKDMQFPTINRELIQKLRPVWKR